MTRRARWVGVFCISVGMTAVMASIRAVLAQGPPATPDQAAQETPAKKVIAKCVICHNENWRYPVLAIFQSKHAVIADRRTPFADRACETCHGVSDDHVANPIAKSPKVVFGGKNAVSAAEQNKVCLTCHQSGLRMNWQGSLHESSDVACVSCHQVHTGKDRVLAKTTQPEVCFGCHKLQRAQVARMSHHPIREGKVACSQCHNPHGSAGPKMLVKATLNETCYTCHADKRGPFAWEHSPAREDCTNCHVPHGSIHRPLLKARIPWLCQECHQAISHPSTAYSGNNVSLLSAPDRVLAKSCLNCHSQVHGSNHPSGARKQR